MQSTFIGLTPAISTLINNGFLLGLAVMGAYTMAKQASRDKKVESIKNTGEAIHTLSNSAMGAQLKMNVQFAQATAILAERIADMTKETGDIAASTAAKTVVKDQEALLQAHLIQQAKVDADKANQDALQK